ncbi:glycosyltransferase family 39 protein [Streptomyces sp. NPDC005301]|uniref:glycosyltransferase family 39 protein n=1 Tax=Streptomyces sp. NPDC005301 TaxID=3156874 RepID=UPI0033A9B80B
MLSECVGRWRVGRAETAAVLGPVLAMLAMGLWGLDRGGMWRDEAVTFQVARRSVPQIWHLLHEVDAVHGLYYLLMHLVLAVRPGEVPLRLPSVCAAAAAAGLVAALGSRLCRPRVGLWAGLLYAVAPAVGHYAQEGRSYAMVAAGAAGATLLLVRAVTATPNPAEAGARARVGDWCGYGAVVAVTCLLHELAVLLLLAHAATLARARVPGRVWRGWLCAAGAALAVLLPLAVVSHGQAAQVAWLVPPDGRSVERLVEGFAGPSEAVLVPYLVLAACALLPVPAPRGRLSLASVALPLAVVPPAVLMGVSQVVPLYDERYVLYALAGAPLLAAAGLERVLRLSASALARAHRTAAVRWALVSPAAAVRRAAVLRGVAVRLPKVPRAPGVRWVGVPQTAAARKPAVSRAAGVPWARVTGAVRRGTRPPFAALCGVLLVALVLLCQLPLLQRDRSADHRPDDLAAVSEVAARRLRPGDPVLFLPAIGRRTALAYPHGFRGTRDVALGVPAPASGTLYGRETGPAELRRRLAALDRVWVVAERFTVRPSWYPPEPTERVKLAVVDEQFVPRETYTRRGVTLRLYVRRPPVPLWTSRADAPGVRTTGRLDRP